MKKKIAVLFLASILALSAAACNSGSSGTTSKVESAGGTTSSVSSVAENSADSKAESKTESKTESKSDDKAESKADESKSETSSSNSEVKDLINKSYFDVMKNGKYYMSMTLDTSSMASLDSSSDTPSEITMVMAANIADQKMYIDLGYPMMGFQKIIVADGKQWMLDDTNKIAYYTPTTDDVQKSLDSMAGNMALGSADMEKNMKYVSDSVENFNGKDCYAVVYEVKSEVSLAEGVSMTSSSGLSTEQTYYFDKETNKLVGIKTNAMGVNTSIVINELTSEIPADLFTIPADYKKSDMSSMMSATASAE